MVRGKPGSKVREHGQNGASHVLTGRQGELPSSFLFLWTLHLRTLELRHNVCVT
jgi:hypothetical protein